MYGTVPTTEPCEVTGLRAVVDCARRRTDDRLGQPEVEQPRAALGQHDVAGLQVPVHDALPVRVIERGGDLAAFLSA